MFAVGIAAAALAGALSLLLAILGMRAARRWQAWRLTGRQERWRTALQAAAGDPEGAHLAPISPRELDAFVALFNQVHESLEGGGRDALARMVRRCRLDDRILALLGQRSPRLRLIAITALGHLREERAWDALALLARDPGPVVSFAAARALLRIEPRKALEMLAPAIVQRADWPLARIGSLFQELGPAVVTPPLVNMLVARPRDSLERVVKLARFGQRNRVAPIVRGWLSASDDPEVIVAALHYVEDAEDLRWAKAAAQHAEWAVRMAAAKALGRIGERQELVTLMGLLSDPVWWVRYHAAQSLTRLSGLEDHELARLRQDARDAYASDMLAQALAERARRA